MSSGGPGWTVPSGPRTWSSPLQTPSFSASVNSIWPAGPGNRMFPAQWPANWVYAPEEVTGNSTSKKSGVGEWRGECGHAHQSTDQHERTEAAGSGFPNAGAPYPLPRQRDEPVGEQGTCESAIRGLVEDPEHLAGELVAKRGRMQPEQTAIEKAHQVALRGLGMRRWARASRMTDSSREISAVSTRRPNDVRR